MKQIYTAQWIVLWWKDVLTEGGLKFCDCCTDTRIHVPFLAGDQEKNLEAERLGFPAIQILFNHGISKVTILRCHPFKYLGGSPKSYVHKMFQTSQSSETGVLRPMPRPYHCTLE